MWRRIIVAGLAVALLGVAPAGAVAAGNPPVEHGGFVGVDPQFSANLTSECGFPVVVTINESDTFVNNDQVSLESTHITGTVVGNGHTLMLKTQDLGQNTDTTASISGLVVQVFDASGRRLTQITGLFLFLEDGSFVFHGQLPEFSLCDFLI